MLKQADWADPCFNERYDIVDIVQHKDFSEFHISCPHLFPFGALIRIQDNYLLISHKYAEPGDLPNEAPLLDRRFLKVAQQQCALHPRKAPRTFTVIARYFDSRVNKGETVHNIAISLRLL